MKQKKKRLNLSLDDDTIDRIRLISLEKQMNMSDVITDLVWMHEVSCDRINALTAKSRKEHRHQK